MILRALATAAISLSVLTGCASTSPKPAFNEVARTVETRSGHRVRWDQGAADDKEADKAVDRLLETALTADAAVQIALLAK